MKAHIRQSPNCWLAHSLGENETSAAIAASAKSNFELGIQSERQLATSSESQALNSKEAPAAITAMIIVSSASAELAPINCIAFSSQISYLIIEDLYHKQKALLAKAEEELEARVLEIKAYLEELEMLDAKEAAEQAAVQAKEAAAAAQKAMEQEAAAAEEAAKQAVMEAAKPEACSKDIDFFDSIMMVNLSELHLSVNCASFLQNLGEQAAKYQESSVLKALQTSLRGSALI